METQTAKVRYFSHWQTPEMLLPVIAEAAPALRSNPLCAQSEVGPVEITRVGRSRYRQPLRKLSCLVPPSISPRLSLPSKRHAFSLTAKLRSAFEFLKTSLEFLMPTFSTQLRIAVLFGGRSTEHDVSVFSATNVVAALEPAKYDVMPIFVTREGQWLLSSFENGALAKPESGTEVLLVPGGRGRMIAIEANGWMSEAGMIDILLPVLHGLYGEDGSVQGLAEVARVPLAGCGILGSVTAMDKVIAKQLLRAAGLPVARSVTISEGCVPNFAALENELGLPLFIKPARQGSSVGVSKVSGIQEYMPALSDGFRYDRNLLAEECIHGREIEFSVLEDTAGGLFVSRAGEIVPSKSYGFYSYDAKYIDEDGAALKVPAELPPEVEATMREMAAMAFRALGCDGMARVDFFLTTDMRFFVNELNTIPGFTNISMYAKAMAASGISYPEIIDRLVAHALARAGVILGREQARVGLER